MKPSSQYLAHSSLPVSPQSPNLDAPYVGLTLAQLTGLGVPPSRRRARPLTQRATCDDEQTPRGVASSGRRARARCVPDGRSPHGYSRSLTVGGSKSPQVEESPGGSQVAPQTSQADSAGSILVTRSSVKSQVSGSRWSLAPGLWNADDPAPSPGLPRLKSDLTRRSLGERGANPHRASIQVHSQRRKAVTSPQRKRANPASRTRAR